MTQLATAAAIVVALVTLTPTAGSAQAHGDHLMVTPGDLTWADVPSLPAGADKEVGRGAPNPTWIPVAHDVARRLGRRDDAVPAGSATDLIERPITAHFIGGCPIGDSPETGVVDPYQRLYGHPGLHVADGSAVAANLGVNPSLTITAQAERALSMWPNRGDADPRPALGEPYRRVEAVAPRAPAVPATAPAALRLTPR